MAEAVAGAEEGAEVVEERAPVAKELQTTVVHSNYKCFRRSFNNTHNSTHLTSIFIFSITAHQILSLAGISFDRKVIIVSTVM